HLSEGIDGSSLHAAVRGRTMNWVRETAEDPTATASVAPLLPARPSPRPEPGAPPGPLSQSAAFSNTETSLESMLATAKSRKESPLKSAATTERGNSPTS